MERPNILNIPDFFIIGGMVLVFFLMLGVLGDAILYYRSMKNGGNNGQ